MERSSSKTLLLMCSKVQDLGSFGGDEEGGDGMGRRTGEITGPWMGKQAAAKGGKKQRIGEEDEQQQRHGHGQGMKKTKQEEYRSRMMTSSTTTMLTLERGCQQLQGGSSVANTGRENGRCGFLGKKWTYWVLMLASSVSLVVGLSVASLLGRYYFVSGGSRKWLYTWIESAGWPMAIPLLVICYWKQGTRPITLTKGMLATYVGLGVLTSLDNLLYSLGMSYLPVSTNSLLCSTQLAFNAVFSFALAGHRLSPATINAVVVISTSTAILSISSASDRPVGTSHSEYVFGFIVTIAASAIFGLLLTLIELTFRKHLPLTTTTGDERNEANDEDHGHNSGGEGDDVRGKDFTLVLEVQMGISIVASICSLVGMWASNDFSAIQEEATRFDNGILAYVMTLFWSAIGWELYLLGGIGIIFLSSSLMSCVFMTAMIPILPILAVIFFNDTFSTLKGIAMALSIWGFISYIYDGFLFHKSHQQDLALKNASHV